jgi:AcrR family transcriptional regulator
VSIPVDINANLVSTVGDMNVKRSYDMSSRTEAAARTRRRILEASLELAMEDVMATITLDHVAARAGVSVKTVLRHFGSRDGLFGELETWAREQIAEERYAPPGDVRAAVRAVFDHYELRGDAVLRLLAQEFWNDQLRRDMDHGRREHRAWVETVFEPQLGNRSLTDRQALTDLLVVAADVYTWKLLRRDRRLSRAAAESRVRRMIDALLDGPREER